MPEVNTTESDLHSIVNDLVLSGVTFVQKEMQSYLIAIDWSNSIPQFVLGNSFNSSIQKLNAIGKYSINVGTKKYCIGNKDVITHQYLGCPVRAELHDNAKKCPDCERHDYLKYCVRCTGRRCFANRKDVLDRCNQEHFVYLTYFPNDIIKVGVAHSRRKYTRLYEQGAVFSYIIASCPSGEAARKLEDHIRKMGFKDRVTSSYKIHNIASFNEDNAEQKLQAAYQQIVNNSELNEFEKSAIISPPERVTRLEIIELLNGFMPGAPQQLSLWDIIKIEEEKSSVEIMETIDGFQGELVQFIGTIGIIKENKTYKLFDFKPIIGKEFEIKEIRARNSHTP